MGRKGVDGHELYKVVGKDAHGTIVQVSDLHEWDRCQDLYHEYLEERDDVSSVDIIYVGFFGD